MISEPLDLNPFQSIHVIAPPGSPPSPTSHFEAIGVRRRRLKPLFGGAEIFRVLCYFLEVSPNYRRITCIPTP